jgi:ligand-binding sensor domain-containing protein
MYQDGDEVWFCSTEANIYRFEAGRFLPYLFEPDHIPGRIWCLFKYSQQRFWVGSRDVVYCYDDHQRTRVLTSKDGLIHDTVRAICEDGHGHIWFGAPHGVSAYDEQSFVNYTTENGLSNNEIWHLYCDSKHRIWISTFSGGTTCYDGPSFFSYTPDDGLLEDSVNQVFEVREGNDWFSHNTTGLSRFEPHCFEVITADPVAEGGFSRDPAERLWYGSFSKLGLPNGDRLTSIQMPAPINAILNDRQGGLWVGTYGPAIYESWKMKSSGLWPAQRMGTRCKYTISLLA